MKKLTAILLCLVLLLALVAACAGDETPAPSPAPPTDDNQPPADNNNDTNDNEQQTEEPTAPTGDVTQITVWFMGGTATSYADVVEAANARLQELNVNVAINPVFSGGWAMGDEAQIALDTGDTSIDIFWTGSWGLNYSPNAARGNFVRLDDPNNNLLEQYGQDMKTAVPDILWDAFTVNGPSGLGLYGIPGHKDYAQLYAWDVNNTLLEELGFDFDEMFDMNGINYQVLFSDEFEAAMQAAKDAGGPNFFPLAIEGDGFARTLSSGDTDLTGASVFHFTFNPDNPALPTDFLPGMMYENEEMLAALERLHHFWNQGFIDPRAAIPAEASSVFVDQRNAGEYLFATTVYAFGHTAQASLDRGIDARFPPISKPIISTVSATGSGFAISVYSQNQAAAMQFMNAWYTDQQLADTLAEGVEGTHFTRNADGTITRIPGARDSYATWRFGMGNIFVLSPLDVDGPDYFDGFRAYNAEGTPTTFLGFSFDPANVVTEMSAIAAVVAEHSQTLNVGATEPRAAAAAFAADLRNNGYEALEAELHRQLEEFFASR